MNAELLLQIMIMGGVVYIATHLLVPWNIKLARRWGIIAHLDERKIHTESKPEAGGLSYALPMTLALAVLGLLNISDPLGPMLFWLSGVGFLTLLLGVADDKLDLRARYKLLGQLAIALLMCIAGFRIYSVTNPLGSEFMLGWLSFPVTIVWYVVIMNAMNLIDGIDGLASGICVIVSGVLLIVGIKEQNGLVSTLSALLLVGNLAFLRYNFSPAKIFLGDTGAMYNGLIVAAISIAGRSQFKGITSMTLLVPLSVMAIPLIDMTLAVFRRIGVGSIFKADKAHLHHAMLALGLSQKHISLIVYVVTLLFGLIAIGFSFSSKRVLFTVLLGSLILAVVVAYMIMRQENKK